MNVDGYWTLIDDARGQSSGECADTAEALTELLAQRPPADIADAETIFDALSNAAYGWPLWGAAYVHNGGCSDDGFDYFRGWLIAQGRSVYEGAVADPDSLADLVVPGVEPADDDWDYEDMLSTAVEAYERATGKEMPSSEYPARPDLGDGWDFDDGDEMVSRYPRLVAACAAGDTDRPTP